MNKKISVYRSDDYKNALISSGEEVIDVSDSFFAVEKAISLPFIGKKKILETRGSANEEDLIKFKEKSKEYFYGTIAPCVINPENELFEKLEYGKISNFTILIDLKKSEDELWKALDKGSIRWGVNYAKKNGLVFGVVESESLIEKFYEMYESTAKEGGFKAEKKEFIKKLIKTNISKLFLVKKGADILAGGMILIDKNNNYSILDLTSVNEEGMKMQAMPFLYWNLILYSKSLKLDYFDLGGYDREAKEGEKTSNINKFKERFSGEIREQPIYSTNQKYGFFRGILKKFRFLKGAYKKE